MGTNELQDKLKAVALFAALSDRDRKHVVASGRSVVHEPGHEIVTEGAGSVGLHLILEGTAKVEVKGHQRPPLAAGDFFGEISLLDGKPRSATVTAGDGGVTTFAVTAWTFSGLLKKFPEMNEAIIAELCARIRAVESVPSSEA
jgi:CRP/FNR family cyclic AMP-dependent transcriptional regulator